ncbi:MAG: hypothetical protein CVV53_07110, partial [Spirochaetae bacterium HGW-Spirochaetae-9]
YDGPITRVLEDNIHSTKQNSSLILSEASYLYSNTFGYTRFMAHCNANGYPHDRITGGYLTADAAAGKAIPLYVLTSFGGRELRDGLGSSIRGYRGWGYEAARKAEASFELRLVGPGLFGVASLRPMAYVFGDAGWFGGLYDCPDAATGGDKDGWIFSAGAGAAIDILDFAYMGLRAGWKFPIDDPLYATYFGSEKFFWGITFLLHF